jgi:hypothetical protein
LLNQAFSVRHSSLIRTLSPLSCVLLYFYFRIPEHVFLQGPAGRSAQTRGEITLLLAVIACFSPPFIFSQRRHTQSIGFYTDCVYFSISSVEKSAMSGYNECSGDQALDFSCISVLYSTLLHLPPLRFHCAGGCWDRKPRTVATSALAVRRSNHSVTSQPLLIHLQ